jgi:iron complex transport system substrate-binding protein
LTGVAPAKPQRVMSLNACTDQLVLLIAPPERIRSVSYLAARSAATAQLRQLALKTPVNHGLAEEILAQAPDLVIAGPYTSLPAQRLARRSGARVIDIDAADSVEDIRRITRQVAGALGEPARGEALIQRMDAQLAALDRTRPARPMRAIGWNGAGRVPGKHSLFDAILTAAGGVNLGAGGGAFERSLDLEQLLALRPRPDLLLYTAADQTAPTLKTAAVQHPVLRQAYNGRRLAVPDYACGTPQIADQASALRQQMLAALDARP